MIIMAAQVERADLTLLRRWKTACWCAVWNRLCYWRQYVVVLMLISAHVTAAQLHALLAPEASWTDLQALEPTVLSPSTAKSFLMIAYFRLSHARVHSASLL